MAINLSPDYLDLSLLCSFLPPLVHFYINNNKDCQKFMNHICFSAWYDERTSGALSTFLKPLPTACCL